LNALLLVVVLAQFAPQRAGTQPLEPALEARVQTLGKQLRCTVCQGMSIAGSPAQMARAQLDTVRSLVSEGKTDQEIRDYFVARYGEWALLEPPAHGFNLVVWLGPAMVIAIGLLAIARLFRNRPAAVDAPADPSAPPPVESSGDPYLDAIRAEVKK
jgi:cytochrome c-type biogenesis protein CcmH